MGEKELRRVEVLARVASGELRLSDAAVLLQVSCRQAKRLARRYRQGGPAALRHGSAGHYHRATPDRAAVPAAPGSTPAPATDTPFAPQRSEKGDISNELI
jgi:hypothetical protein